MVLSFHRSGWCAGIAVDYDFHHFHSLSLRQTTRYGLVPPLAPQSPLCASAASLVVPVPAPVWFLLVPVSVLASALSNLWYFAAHPCFSWLPFGLLQLAIRPHGGCQNVSVDNLWDRETNLADVAFPLSNAWTDRISRFSWILTARFPSPLIVR
ncbi:hypothetical protein V8G54_024079 [Vigna mungo]|uniref:Uncharacterized protein n=1 Tax=Vigna mungo TaxID=3915 RepID=A0AAQ3RS74_VIGMU